MGSQAVNMNNTDYIEGNGTMSILFLSQASHVLHCLPYQLMKKLLGMGNGGERMDVKLEVHHYESLNGNLRLIFNLGFKCLGEIAQW